MFPIELAVGSLPRTAITVTVRNEDMRLVLPSLRYLLHDLDAAGAGDGFALFILSDTLDPVAGNARKPGLAASMS